MEERTYRDEITYREEFSKRLYELRQKKGVSARDMSLSNGWAHNYVNSLESGKAFPSMLNFLYMCEYLGISPREFFDYGNVNPYLDNELFEEIKRLDSSTQEHFLRLIKDVNNMKKR